jgi:hypothetical protein
LLEIFPVRFADWPEDKLTVFLSVLKLVMYRHDSTAAGQHPLYIILPVLTSQSPAGLAGEQWLWNSALQTEFSPEAPWQDGRDEQFPGEH